MDEEKLIIKIMADVDDLKKGMAKVEDAIEDGTKEVKDFDKAIDKLDDGRSLDNLDKDIDEIKKSTKQTGGAIGGWDDAFKGILAGGSIANIADGVMAVADTVGKVVQNAMEASKNRTIIRVSMDLDEESVKAVEQSIKGVEAYGLDSQEALEGVRKQFVLNKDKSTEFNDSIVKGAGYLATAYSGLDFTEIIQETYEIGKQLKIGQDEALGLVDALLKAGFPPEELDIISEYAKQLEMAGYEAKDIQGIFAAGIKTGSWNIDKLLDGVKEGRIKLTEFATEIPAAVKPAIKSLNMTEEEFQALAKEVAKGGPAGKKAFDKVAKAIVNMDDKTEQARVGTAIFGTLWEENGVTIAETLVEGSEKTVTMKGNVDDLNKSVAALDDEPLVKYNEAMAKLDANLMPVKTGLANMVSGILEEVNAAMEGTSVSMKKLDKGVADFLASGSANAAAYGILISEAHNGMVMVANETSDTYRYLTDEELKMWEERKAAAETNMEGIASVQEEKLSTMRLNNQTETEAMAADTEAGAAAMTTAIQDYAAKSGLSAEEAQTHISELANKYNVSEDDIITVLQNWGGEIEDFAATHDANVDKIKSSVDTFVEAATTGFTKIEQNSTVSLKTYQKNMEANQKATEKWTENTQKLMNAGVSEGIIKELEKLGPEGAKQAEVWVKELEKMNGGSLTEFEGLNKKTKEFLTDFSETYGEGITAAGEAAEVAHEANNYGGQGNEMVNAIVDGIVERLPYLKNTAFGAGDDAGNGLADGFSNSEVKANVRAAAQSTGRIIEDEIDDSLKEIKKDAANLTWKINRPSIPTFDMKGSFNAQTGTVPKVTYSWQARGGIFKKPTLFPNSGIGVGDASNGFGSSPEVVAPLADLKQMLGLDNNNRGNTIINLNGNYGFRDKEDMDYFMNKLAMATRRNNRG